MLQVASRIQWNGWISRREYHGEIQLCRSNYFILVVKRDMNFWKLCVRIAASVSIKWNGITKSSGGFKEKVFHMFHKVVDGD
jgi:hypothetical protein